MRHAIDIAVIDEDAGPAGKKLHRVGEASRHDGFARREGLDEHAGTDLVTRVVREEHHVDAAHEGREQFPVAVASSNWTRSPTPRADACDFDASRYCSPSAARTFGCVSPATMYEIAGEWMPNRAIAAIPCSIPFPGLNRPQVKTDGRGMSDSIGPEKLGAAPCGIMITASGFASCTATMRWSSAWLCTTATAALSRIRSSTSRWCALGSNNAVWSTATSGTWRPSMRSSTCAPSRPPNNPYSC